MYFRNSSKVKLKKNQNKKIVINYFDIKSERETRDNDYDSINYLLLFSTWKRIPPNPCRQILKSR